MKAIDVKKLMEVLQVRTEEEGALSPNDKQAHYDKMVRFWERVCNRLNLPFREDGGNVPDDTEIEFIEEQILGDRIDWLERRGVSSAAA